VNSTGDINLVSANDTAYSRSEERRNRGQTLRDPRFFLPKIKKLGY